MEKTKKPILRSQIYDFIKKNGEEKTNTEMIIELGVSEKRFASYVAFMKRKNMIDDNFLLSDVKEKLRSKKVNNVGEFFISTYAHTIDQIISSFESFFLHSIKDESISFVVPMRYTESEFIKKYARNYKSQEESEVDSKVIFALKEFVSERPDYEISEIFSYMSKDSSPMVYVTITKIN